MDIDGGKEKTREINIYEISSVVGYSTISEN